MSRGTASAETKAFALRLAAIREERGFTSRSAFAKAIGVEPPAYRKWERGESEPGIAQLVRIQEVTGTSLDFLIAGRSPGYHNVLPFKAG